MDIKKWFSDNIESLALLPNENFRKSFREIVQKLVLYSLGQTDFLHMLVFMEERADVFSII